VVSIDRYYFCHLPCHANLQPYFDANKFRLRYRVSRDFCENVRKGLLFDWHDTVKDLGFIGSSRQEQTVELTRARLIQALA
jgi:hypothetical protein